MFLDQAENGEQSVRFLKDQRWEWALNLLKSNLRLLSGEHLAPETFDQKWEEDIKENLIKIWEDAMKCGYSGRAILDALCVLFRNFQKDLEPESLFYDFWPKIFPILEAIVTNYLIIPHSTEDGSEIAKVRGDIQILTRLRLSETLKNLGEFLKPRPDDFRNKLLPPVQAAIVEGKDIVSSLQTAYSEALKGFDSPGHYYSHFLVELINQILRDTGIDELQEIRRVFLNRLIDEPFHFILYNKEHGMIQLKRQLSGGMKFVNFKISKDNFSKAELRIESNYPDVKEVVEALNKVLRQDPTFIIPYKLKQIDPKGRPLDMGDYKFHKVVPENPTQCEFLLNLERALGMKRTAADNKAMLTLCCNAKGFTFTLPSGTLEVPMDIGDKLGMILVAKDADCLKKLEKEANQVLASVGIKEIGNMGTFISFKHNGRLGKYCLVQL